MNNALSSKNDIIPFTLILEVSYKLSHEFQEAIQSSRVIEKAKLITEEIVSKDINELVDDVSTLLLSALPQQRENKYVKKKRQ